MFTKLLFQEIRRNTSINQSVFFLFAVHFLFFYIFFLEVASSDPSACILVVHFFVGCGFLGRADPGIVKTTCMAGFTSKHYKPAPYI